MTNKETRDEKRKRFTEMYAQKSDDELMELFERMKANPALAGDFVLVITTVKAELVKRGLISD